MTVINLQVSENNEGTSEPYWLIIDPTNVYIREDEDEADVHNIASSITGPFFSRESAENHLANRRYAFGSNAVVYCHSGYWSNQYKNAIRNGVTDEEIAKYRNEPKNNALVKSLAAVMATEAYTEKEIERALYMAKQMNEELFGLDMLKMRNSELPEN